jgi:hypothetical protein
MRENYIVVYLVFLVALLLHSLSASTYVRFGVGHLFFPAFILLAIVFAGIGLVYRCRNCGYPIGFRFQGEGKMPLYSAWPAKNCSKCGNDLE